SHRSSVHLGHGPLGRAHPGHAPASGRGTRGTGAMLRRTGTARWARLSDPPMSVPIAALPITSWGRWAPKNSRPVDTEVTSATGSRCHERGSREAITVAMAAASAAWPDG